MLITMNSTLSIFPWWEKQLQEISNKTLDPIAAEVGEIILVYNDELSKQEKLDLKNYLKSWEFQSSELPEKLQKIKDIIDTWTDSIKDYCLVKLNTQDELFNDLTEEHLA